MDFAVVSLLLCAGCFAAALWIAIRVRSAPAVLAGEATREIAADVAQLRGAWEDRELRLVDLHKRVLDVLENVEYKRKQTASSAAKVARAQGLQRGNTDPVASADADFEAWATRIQLSDGEV